MGLSFPVCTIRCGENTTALEREILRELVCAKSVTGLETVAGARQRMLI